MLGIYFAVATGLFFFFYLVYYGIQILVRLLRLVCSGIYLLWRGHGSGK